MDSFGKEDTAKSWNNSTQAMKKNKQKSTHYKTYVIIMKLYKR